MLYLIIACEILFWFLLAAGLTARYPLRLRTLGAALLLCVPLIDVVLLVTTVLHVRSGADPEIWHGLSAAYLGITVVYGHGIMRWADEKFAQRYEGKPKPPPRKLYGGEAIAEAWKDWFKFLLAYAISAALMVLLVVLAGTPEGVQMMVWLNPLTKILIYSMVWPVIVTIWPGKKPQEAPVSK